MGITQKQYIQKVAQRFNQFSARSIENPSDASLKLSSVDSP